MLNTIKNLINSKKAYVEATNLILENDELDDSIVLSEEPEEPEIQEPKTDEPEVQSPVEPEGIEADKNIEDEDGIGAGGEPKPADGEAEAPAETPLPLPGTEELPAPAGGDDTADILTAEIDLATNTQTDVLPVPPANASDAIVGDDFMTQTVDSGFGGEEEKPPIDTTTDIMNDPIDEPTPSEEETEVEEDDIMKEAVDDTKIQKHTEELQQKNKEGMAESTEDENAPFTEAISIGDETPAEAPAEGDNNTAPDASAEAPAEGEEENPVTAAVKDKVDEITSEEQPEQMSVGASKEEIMKKLSSLTKSIEDTKNLVMSGIQ